MQSIRLTTEDLNLNQQGKITRRQIKVLAARKRYALAGVAGLILILAMALAVLVYKLINPAFLERGQLYFWIPLGIVWIWLLRKSPADLAKIGRDLRSGQVDCITGPVYPRWENSPGLWQVTHYRIQAGDQIFMVSRDDFFKFQTGQTYQIFFSPLARAFLGARLVTALSPDNPDQSPGNQQDKIEITNLLSPREMELLRYASTGLSNKEIAAVVHLSVNSIKMYLSQSYRKLGVKGRNEAVARLRRAGLI